MRPQFRADTWVRPYKKIVVCLQLGMIPNCIQKGVFVILSEAKNLRGSNPRDSSLRVAPFRMTIFNESINIRLSANRYDNKLPS